MFFKFASIFFVFLVLLVIIPKYLEQMAHNKRYTQGSRSRGNFKSLHHKVGDGGSYTSSLVANLPDKIVR